MADQMEVSTMEPVEAGRAGGADDDRSSLALAAGLVAAIVAGLAWAAIAVYGNLEIGWAAWGVGLLVGGAMARVTANRSRGLGSAAATLAAVGLLVGKLATTMGSAGAVADQLTSDLAYLEGPVAWEMYENGELVPAVQQEVAATLEAGDTLSDAVWAAMRGQAAERIATMSGEEREAMAQTAARGYIDRLGIVDGVLVQLGLWDILWFSLALATAFRMMAEAKPEEAAVPA